MTRRTTRPARPATLTLALAALLAAGAAAVAGAATAQQLIEPRVTEVSPGDDVSVLNAALSPDGRWLAYSRMTSETSASLWIMPAGGGASSRLTGDGAWDENPVWGGPDRLFFRSNRVARGADRYHGMVIGVDPATGRATGSPRQVTVEPIAAPSLQPSPDGRSLVYVTLDAGVLRLHVVPAAGGNARTVAELEPPIWNLGWLSDDELVFSRRPDRGETRIVYRLPARGGEPVEVLRADANIRAIGPGARTAIVTRPGPTPRQTTLEVVDRDGQVLARHVGDANLRPGRMAADGRTLVGTRTEITAPIRVVPVTGGRPLDVTPASFYNWHAAWIGDGSELLFYGATDERSAILTARRGGGLAAAPAIPLPDEPDAQWLTATGDFVAYHTAVPGTDRRRLVAIDRRDGSRHVVSENFVRGPGAVGAGGHYEALGDELLYLERTGDRVELRAARPGAASRLIRAFPADIAGRSLAVHGGRVAWYEQEGDSARLFLSTGPADPPIVLRSVPAGDRCCRVNLTFSHDGQRMLTEPLGDDGFSALVLLELAADGRSVARSRTFDSGAHYWYEAQWLPGGNAVTILAGYEGLRTHVLLVPFRDGEAPVMVTRDDPSPKWGQMLSPDGRFVAYPGEVWHGGVIWTMDLSPVAQVARRGR